MFNRDLSELYGKEDDNPVSLLVRRMQVPVMIGVGGALAIQATKGVFETPALFGRIAHTTLPICGIGFYYLVGTYITQRIRKKDDAFNHLFGAYCTFPVLRKFMPLTFTVAVLFFISLPLYAIVDGFKVSEYQSPIRKTMGYGVQMTSYDINRWLKAKSSEPFVKRESYNLFTIPSK